MYSLHQVQAQLWQCKIWHKSEHSHVFLRTPYKFEDLLLFPCCYQDCTKQSCHSPVSFQVFPESSAKQTTAGPFKLNLDVVFHKNRRENLVDLKHCFERIYNPLKTVQLRSVMHQHRFDLLNAGNRWHVKLRAGIWHPWRFHRTVCVDEPRVLTRSFQ